MAFFAFLGMRLLAPNEGDRGNGDSASATAHSGLQLYSHTARNA